MTKKDKNTQPSYQEALAEVEKILAQMEAGQLGIDQMTEAVPKAMAYLALCKDKLRTTEEQIDQLLGKE